LETNLAASDEGLMLKVDSSTLPVTKNQQGTSLRHFLKTRNKIFVAITIAILLLGAVVLSIGLVPHQTPNYVLVGTCQTPATDQSGNFITNPEQYCLSQNQVTQSFSVYNCIAVGAGYKCTFYVISGYGSTTDTAAQDVGLAIITCGAVALAVLARPIQPSKAQISYNSRKIRILVNEGICVANTVCVGIAPKVFQLEPEKKGALAPKVKVIDPYGADNDTIIEAAKMCPTQAIMIEDAITGERIFPVPK
jgi:ferredoxin